MRSDVLVNPDGLAKLSRDARVDRLCDDFERVWSSDSRPTFNAYLEQCPPAERPQLFTELMLVDWELCNRNAETPSCEEYLSTYPEYAEQIEAVRFKYSTFKAVPASGIAPTLQSHQRIDHFQLVERIGSGAAGDVWKAKDLRLQRLVALKIPRWDFESPKELDRFLREGRAAAQLRHANIVPVYEVGRDHDTPYNASALIQGLSLKERIHAFVGVPIAAAQLAATIAEALHHAHEHGVIHRDLKPSNVLMDEQGQPHLADFGLAKWMSDPQELTLDGQLLGTPAYMSPEQARGDAVHVDRRTDIYALGLILYETLTDERPFVLSGKKLLDQIIHDDPLPPHRTRPVPRDLETVCLKALEKEPGRRYQTAQEMAEDLLRFANGEPVLARPRSAIERGLRVMKRHWVLVMFGLLSLATVASLGIAGSIQHQNHALLGLKRVVITSKPAGARVALIPMNPNTGLPEIQKVIRPAGRTPLEVEVEARDYEVIAVLDAVRFHEVLRHVPREITEVPGPYKHCRWEIDSSGAVVLPTICLPEEDLAPRMALIEPSIRNMTVGSSPHTRPFLMAPFEFTVADFKQLSDKHELPVDRRWRVSPDNYALCAAFDQAISIAERTFCRLPTEAEFEMAVSHCDRTTSASEDQIRSDIGAVGACLADHTSTSPPIYGLRSNVAEWTTSLSAVFDRHSDSASFVAGVSPDFRVVRGGDWSVIKDEAERSNRDAATTRTAVSRYALEPGLGFRCVRSLHPLIFDDAHP